jgi:dihydroneopterin aldolase/2-amino-4-hydroxy-6-hydroxymethyldihydropteridine diphosphokinase
VDKILVEDLEVFGSHGSDQKLDRFLISAELTLNLKTAGDTDRISQTINYVDLCSDIEKYFSDLDYKLIESSAEYLASHILLNYISVRHVVLTIKMISIPKEKKISFTGIKIEREWHTAFIGVGSNLGDRYKNILDAESKINISSNCKVVNISKIYETEPFGYLDQEKFLNCVFEIKTLLTPLQFINSLLEIEKSLKRERIIHWGPRTIDLDILFFDDIITSFEAAVIPHPRMHERMFVLKPLCDLTPYYVHPVLNERCYRIAEKLEKDQPAPLEWLPSDDVII